MVQGSIVGPALFTIFIDKLIRRIKLPGLAFADDYKMIADVCLLTQAEVQRAIKDVADRSDEVEMSLSIEKCGVLHGGTKQPLFDYVIKDAVLQTFETVKDLGIIRSASGSYSDHVRAVANKASRVAGAIRHAFFNSSPKLVWPAFQSYVLPILMYASPVWNPTLIKDIQYMERVQRRFTKRLRGFSALSYADRLKELGAHTLAMRRNCADAVLIHRALHGVINYPACDLGVRISTNHTRGDSIRLVQRRATRHVSSAMFCTCATSAWNKLPIRILSARNLRSFKTLLHNHFH